LKRINTTMGWTLALLLSALAVPAAVHAQQAPQAQQGQAGAFASAARMPLRWELLRQLSDSKYPEGGSEARLILANGDTRPLPGQGWSLYFNCMDGVETGALADGLTIEHVAGGLFRLRPGARFAGLAPGQTLNIVYRHPNPVIKTGKAPIGPYLVYDAAPDVAVNFTDYRLLPVGAAGTIAVTPADTFRNNLRADVLPAAQVPLVLPTPQSLTISGAVLPLTARLVVSAAAGLGAEAALAASLFAADLPAGGPALRLSIGAVAGQASPEAYTLDVDPQRGIAIVGNSAAGVAYGLQSLRDLLPLPGADAAARSIPAVHIVDAPRFGYRGFQLDVARNFHGKQTVFKWLDLMARFKLNKFHFHLTDDEGWRLEIAGLPELTSLGAVRGHSTRPGLRLQPAYGSGGDPADTSGSGFYTRADYIEIVRYAAARHIEVIPEIEMPGHARAAVQAMQARYERLSAAGDRAGAAKYLLHDAADRSVYKSPQLYTDHVMNPGLDSSFTFIDHVVGQVAALHRAAGVPLRTIHMGGDELPTGAWEQSPAAARLMASHKLAGTAELWDLFYGRVDDILRKHGLVTSGWEDIGARKTMLRGRPKLIPNPRFTQRGFQAYVWNNTEGAEDLAYRLANAGYDIVLAPVTRMYLDMAYNANPEEPGVNWGAYIELATVYDFIPFDYLKDAGDAARIGKDGLTDYGKAHVKGLEATLFTETVRDPSRIDYMVMPRLAAVAERAWAGDPAWAQESDPAKASSLHRAAWSGFVNALGQRVLPRLDLDGSKVDYRIAPPGLMVDGAGDRQSVLVNHVLPGMTLRYTTDGSLPTAASPVVAGPISARGQIRAAAFDRNGRRGLVAGVERR
jgi:hexosaminidase